MVATGLLNNILLCSADIDKGRKYLATDGLEHDGRIFYEAGISLALSTFKDAQNSACDAHKTRLQNSLRAPGINMIEKAVISQRTACMPVIQVAYAKKQKKALVKKC